MIDCVALKGKKFAVLGLGKSGLATVCALLESGIDVVCWDDHTDNQEKVDTDVVQNLHLYDMSLIDVLVLSPGIAHTLPEPNPIVVRARNAGVKIVNDVSLFKDAYKGDVVAITGTNGKSTTTALLYNVLHQSMSCQVGGNIGTALMSLDQKFDVTVAELSSYQTEITDNLNARGVVWLNITPDHLERHGNMDGYVQAKKKIFETTYKNGVASICIDDTYSQKIYEEVVSAGFWTIIPVSTRVGLDCGVSILDGKIFDKGVCVGSMDNCPRLLGEHNHQNTACTYAMAKYLYGMDEALIIRGFQSFCGLAHRQYHICRIGQVDYINDSKATNADATSKALNAYSNIYWLAGGVAKDGGIETLVPYLLNVKKAYLYGECATTFAKTLESHGCDYLVFDTLDDALKTAHEESQKTGEQGNVLLSPSASSFDQYSNFEARGKAFEALISIVS